MGDLTTTLEASLREARLDAIHVTSPVRVEPAVSTAHQQRAQELKLLAQAASAAAEGADAFALLETLKPLRKPVASAAALCDHAQLGSLEKAAEAAAASVEACLLRLTGARAAVADAVACLSPADVAKAVKEGALPGLAERDAAQNEAGQLLPSAISAYVALAALHAERAELQTHLEGAAASEGEEESVSVSEAVQSLSALDNALARVQTAQHTARALGEPTQPAAAAAPVQYPQFAAMPKAVPFSPRGRGEAALQSITERVRRRAEEAALAAAAIPVPWPTAKRPAFAAGSASIAGQGAAAVDRSLLAGPHAEAWREYFARQEAAAAGYHPGRDGNAALRRLAEPVNRRRASRECGRVPTGFRRISPLDPGILGSSFSEDYGQMGRQSISSPSTAATRLEGLLPDDAESSAFFHAITAQPAYSAHSVEELRWEHYQQTGGQRNHTVNACFSPEQRAFSSHNLQETFTLRPVDGAANLRRYTAALNVEADALAALSAAAASAVFQCRAALRQAVSKCQDETPAEDAAAAASIAMRFRGALRTLSLELASRDGVAAARQELQEASSSRVAALVELVELESERSKRQIQASWSDVAETKFKAAAAALRERVAQAEARWAALERSVLRAPLVARCFPEIAATVAAETAAASSFTPSLSSGKQLCAADFEELEILHKTPSRSVLRARRTHAPSAPDACLKVFLAADVGAFLSEARHLAALASHPLIVRYEGAYTDNAGRGVLVMPFYPAGSIRPWVDEMRAKHSAGGLSSDDWASVRRTFRQLASALSYIHSKRVAHRDLKPENVLWADPSRRTVALSDFGLSRDLSAALETTRAIGATVAYAAPEACTPAWKVSPWAGDIWSLGAMALEVVTGKLYGWSGRRLECVATGASYSTPQGGGAAAQDAVELALAMLREAPGERPTADEVLLHPFFASSDAAMADAAGPGLGVGDGAAPALAAKLSAIAMLSSRTRGGAAWRLELPARPDGAAAPAASAAWWNALLEAVGAAPAHALASTWNAFEAGVHVPLSACLRTFWACAPHARGFLEQCETASRAPGAPPALDLPFLPVRDGGDAPTAAFSALGRLLARCMLDGMAVSVELAPVAFAVLLGREGAALRTTGGALAHLAAWDEAAASSLRSLLASRLGGGSAVLTVDTLMDNGDESPLSDANKHDAVCAAVTAKLVACRRRAFDALRTGFEEVVRAAGADAALSLLDEWELGTVLSGGAQFLDADAMRSRVVWDDTWRSNEPQKAWLDATLQRLSEPALRLLLVRAAGRLRLPDTGPSLLLVRTEGGPESDLPRYHGAGIVSLPPACPSEEAFAARLLRSLGLPEHAIDAPHSAGDKAQLDREARAAFHALHVAGQMRKGAVHECVNGHLYAVGDCGGAMEAARCPECGAGIGGQQHRLAPGNNVRLDVDGARAPAWPPPQ